MDRRVLDAVVLRPIRMRDLDAYVERQDDEMADRFEWEGPATKDGVRATFARWVESWRTGGPERNFAIVDADSGEMIGDAELELREDGFVHVMYVVFGPWRRQGRATHAARLLVTYAAEAFPGRPLLFRIHPDNAGSVRVATALGAEQDGSERSRTGRRLDRYVCGRVVP